MGGRLGNHDDEAKLSRHELFEVWRDHPHCLSERGPEGITGIGNYVVRVASAADDSLAAALYFLDSNSYSNPERTQYAWIAQDQIAWYLETSRALQAAVSSDVIACARVLPHPAARVRRSLGSQGVPRLQV